MSFARQLRRTRERPFRKVGNAIARRLDVPLNGERGEVRWYADGRPPTVTVGERTFEVQESDGSVSGFVARVIREMKTP